jgi:hypothetical protein
VSEDQYYEFLALDRPLTSKQREELRQLSTRAEITATRFTNEYHWGSFRGDPQQMMAAYFDAFLCLANWGTRHLMFRVPRTVLDTELAGQYCYTDAASLIETDDHLIISLYADRDPEDSWDETTGELGAMIAARSELLGGDHRLLYLAWLIGNRVGPRGRRGHRAPGARGPGRPQRRPAGRRRLPVTQVFKSVSEQQCR